MSEEEQTSLEISGEESDPDAGAWRSGFSEDLKANPGLDKFDKAEKPSEALAKSYLEVSKLIGKKGIIPPDENAGEKEWDDFYNSLGRPETVEGYDFNGWEPPESISEVWDDSIRTEMLKEMHKIGITNKQAKHLVDRYASLQGGRYQDFLGEAKSSRETAKSTLQKEWGAAYEPKMQTAFEAFKSACESVGVSHEELAGSLLPDGGLLGDNIVLTKIFSDLGEGNREHAFLGGRSKRTTLTPDEAETEIKKLEAHPGFFDKTHPEHKEIIERRSALYSMRVESEAERE